MTMHFGETALRAAAATQRQAAEQAMRRSEERLRQVVENVGEGILVADDTGQVVFANTRAAAMGGRTVDELLHGLIVVSGNDAAVALAEHTAGGTEAFVERMYVQPDDRVMIVLPMFHMNALFYSVSGTVAAGATMVIVPRFSASAIARARPSGASVPADRRPTDEPE